MNGIKKVFSHHRNSTSDGDDSVSDPMSPKSATSDFSSAGNTSVDETEASGIRKDIAGVGSNTNNSSRLSSNNARSAGTGATTGSTTGATGTGGGALANAGNTAKTNSTMSNSKLGAGRSEEVAATDGTLRHSHGNHLGNSDLSKGKVTQTVEHLGEVTSKTHHNHTIEEVERQRELERHSHHIQVHHQPIKHEEHAAEQIHQKSHPVTKIHEKHASTDKDAKLLSTIAAGHNHKNEVKHAPIDHKIVDNGEIVNESVHHHIHNVVVPLVSHDAHEHHRIKTTIPTHHVLHEAPIIHESSTLEAISKDDFLKRGGVLGAPAKTVDQVNVLHGGQCERKVDGVAEKLAKELNLSTPTPTSTV